MPVVGSTAYPFASDCFQLIRSLLNDADIPTTNIISPTGAVRAANVVTLTTASAHGLQVGNYVQVQNVNDSTFNGTFQIPIGGVISSTQIQYAQTAANSNSGNGVIQLIIQGDVFTDTVLLPFVNVGYRKTQRRLLGAGSPTTTGVVELTLAVGQIDLDDSSSPQLPIDFLAPRVIQEKITTQQQFYGGEMRRVDILPSHSQRPFNYVYQWDNEALHFPGSFNSLDIRLRYMKSTLQPLTDGTSQILIRDGQDCVSYYGAYLAAQSRGSSAAGNMKELFEESISELKNSQAHSRQYRPSRRRSYGMRNLHRGGCGFGTGSV